VDVHSALFYYISINIERAIISSMKTIFEWDESKARINFEKHKISFDEASTIFTDPFLLTFVDDFHSDQEERFISIGLSEKDRVLLAVHTEREEKSETIVIRIISCRKATQTERKRYEKENE
jgi:uncharacterized protein